MRGRRPGSTFGLLGLDCRRSKLAIDPPLIPPLLAAATRRRTPVANAAGAIFCPGLRLAGESPAAGVCRCRCRSRSRLTTGGWRCVRRQPAASHGCPSQPSGIAATATTPAARPNSGPASIRGSTVGGSDGRAVIAAFASRYSRRRPCNGDWRTAALTSRRKRAAICGDSAPFSIVPGPHGCESHNLSKWEFPPSICRDDFSITFAWERCRAAATGAHRFRDRPGQRQPTASLRCGWLTPAKTTA